MAAKSNKNKSKSGGMTLEDAIEKSRVQVANNPELVEKKKSNAKGGEVKSESLRSKSFFPQGIDTSGLEENEKDENLKVKPDALEPPKVNPYTYESDEENEKKPYEELTAGQLLRSHRIKRKMSINEVANEIRARPATVADIENDRMCFHTVKDFAESFIGRYGKLFGLDQDDLIARYRKQLAQSITVISDEKPKKKFDIQLARSWLMVVLVVLVATAGYFVFSAQEASKNEEQKVQIAQNAQIDTTQSAVEIYASNAPQNGQGQVVIQDPNNQNGPEVRVVDENTARATAQQMAMQQSADGSIDLKPAQAAKEKSPLDLPPNANISVANNANIGNANITVANNANNGNVNMSNANIGNANITAPAQTNMTVATEQRDEKLAQAKAKAEAEAKAKAEAEAKAKEAAKDVELSGNLKNISSSVRVVNRDGLASLNRAEISVIKRVALKVVDSSGKVLASGTYDNGDSVKVTGIPPINVQISSTDAVKISYMGGHISMPAGKQVKFDLPMR
ncbi:RodZ domain-containing protein [uncultured Anaerobiospirillum sp.]|uniref:helix-turn-helix domain-containing protein n=1 Tax=uncultured Anaerobiospirillum sp. TaxID=265728 RepID=UPI002804B5F3|nr:RodZ domain-containing protein [uncultured Anaerobiospirillum sp.]